MELTAHFTLAEFTSSDTAARLGINNTVPDDLMSNVIDTALLLEIIRSELGGAAIHVTSGYRCIDLNRAIGSSDTSDHIQGHAVDFKAPEFGSPYDICTQLEMEVDRLGIGQLIYEFDSWVHISTKMVERQVNRVITINKHGTTPGIAR